MLVVVGGIPFLWPVWVSVPAIGHSNFLFREFTLMSLEEHSVTLPRSSVLGSTVELGTSRRGEIQGGSLDRASFIS